jgi:hypothetical protein
MEEGWTDAPDRAYGPAMEQPQQPCALCTDPIGPGEAWMTDEADGRVAHSGCVYRDEEPEDREHWSPGS